MDGILGMVMGQLGGGGLGALSGMLGLGPKETEGAVGTAVSVLTGALAQNAADPKGAQALDAALEKDHDGGIFENITDFLGGAMAGPGAGILGHVLGSQQPAVEKGIAEQTGLSLDKVAPLLIMVAPLVMGALGKLKKDEGLDAEAVATTLAKEKKQTEEADNGIDIGSILGMLGGLAGGSQPTSSTTKKKKSSTTKKKTTKKQEETSGGGLLGMLGSLFGGNKKNG